MFLKLEVLVYMLSVMQILYVSAASNNCSVYKDCKTCASSYSWSIDRCHWCPLSLTCHANASAENPCLASQDITDPSKCKNRIVGTYDPNLAFESALSSAAAYTDDSDACLKKVNPKGGFVVYRTIAHRCDLLLPFKYNCYAYVAVSEIQRMIVLAYRGSRNNSKWQLFDEILSILIRGRVPVSIGGEVEEYFAAAHNHLYPCVNMSVSALVKKYPKYRVIVTGHSLGAALASLAASMLIYHNVVPADKLMLYNFGSPRVGDKDFTLNFDKLVNNSWRLVHYRDIVSRLPFLKPSNSNGPFHHGVEIFYPGENMTIDSKYMECLADEDHRCSDSVSIIDCFKHFSDSITDHRNYFGFRVGTLCNAALKDVKLKKKVNIWETLPRDQCVFIPG